MLNIIEYPENPIELFYLPGVHHHFDVFREILKQNDIKTVVEVGTFCGETAIFLAKFPQIEKVYCVDLWNWNWQGRLPTNPLKQFLSNVLHENVQDKIIPIQGDSTETGKQFYRNDIKVDLVYIDANHKYRNVKGDVLTWYQVHKKIMCGDDYRSPQHNGVIQAVNECAEIFDKIAVNIDGGFWYYTPYS